MPNTLLQSGLHALHLTRSLETQTQLLNYLSLLKKWNKAYNLTAITETDKMITHHLLDSLSVAPYINGYRIVDVGSGAGLPGIPLAIYFPDKQFTLIDSVGKKVRFMQHAVRELGLKNIEIVQTRAEEYQTPERFDIMIARAVAAVEVLVNIARQLLHPQGKLLMMKSEDAPLPGYRVISLSVPGISAKRSLIIKEDWGQKSLQSQIKKAVWAKRPPALI